MCDQTHLKTNSMVLVIRKNQKENRFSKSIITIHQVKKNVLELSMYLLNFFQSLKIIRLCPYYALRSMFWYRLSDMLVYSEPWTYKVKIIFSDYRSRFLARPNFLVYLIKTILKKNDKYIFVQKSFTKLTNKSNRKNKRKHSSLYCKHHNKLWLNGI